MKTQRGVLSQRLFLFLSFLLVITLLGACGGKPSPGQLGIPTGATSSIGALPLTQTSCPAQGMARAAIMPPLRLGNHQTIVYLLGEGMINTFPTFTLNRYDITTGRTTQIVKMSDVQIREAQVSADGQWLLFVAGSKLQMIRLDGQELQTLYCVSAPQTQISSVQWSADQQQVLFFGGGKSDDEQTVSLLNIVDGTIQPELLFAERSTRYIPAQWLDSKRVYLIGFPLVGNEPGPLPIPMPKLYLLDTRHGANQQTKTLQFVTQAQSPYCWDFDRSSAGGKLFVAHCIQRIALGQVGIGLRQGPSSITVQEATGGSSNTIISNRRQAMVAVRVVSTTSLLFLIENQSDGHASVDTSQNGLWKVNIDGSGLTRLTTEQAGDHTSLNPSIRSPWSNVSRDGSLYAARLAVFQGNTPPAYSLVLGSFHGGKPTLFATVSHPGEQTQLELAGWTIM